MDVNYNFAIISDLPLEIHRGSECQGPDREKSTNNVLFTNLPLHLHHEGKQCASLWPKARNAHMT